MKLLPINMAGHNHQTYLHGLTPFALLGFLEGNVAEGFFWFLVVIVTIIVQAVKASRENAARAESKDTTSGRDPNEDELKNFFESLGIQQPPSTKPALQQEAEEHAPKELTSIDKPRTFSASQPQKDPYAQRKNYAPSVVAAEKNKQITTGKKLSVIEKTELQVTDKARVASIASASTPKPAIVTTKHKKTETVNIGSYLKSTDSLRDAILLGEILGPPIAFKSEPYKSIS